MVVVNDAVDSNQAIVAGHGDEHLVVLLINNHSLLNKHAILQY